MSEHRLEGMITEFLCNSILNDTTLKQTTLLEAKDGTKCENYFKFRYFHIRSDNEQLTNTNNSEETVHKEKGHI